MLSISDDYIAGFVDGEGMFYVGVVKSTGSSKNKSGWQVIYFFKVSQNPSGKVVLDTIKKRLDCGYIKANSQSDPTDKSLAYVVRDFSSLKNKVIPFFRDKLFIKKSVLLKFEKILNIVERGEHLTKSGMKEILDISYSMNTKKRKISREQILQSF